MSAARKGMESDMKMLVIFCAGTRLKEVRRLIDEHEVHGYTEIPEVLGSGVTGRHLGTRAWPGTSSVVITAVAAPKAKELMAALESLARSCSPEEGMRVLALPVEKMI